MHFVDEGPQKALKSGLNSIKRHELFHGHRPLCPGVSASIALTKIQEHGVRNRERRVFYVRGAPVTIYKVRKPEGVGT